MAKPVHLEQSHTYSTGVEHAFDVVLATPLPEVFSRRYAAIPAIREVRDQGGAWGTVGQSRTIVLADGGTMREELTQVDRPHSFGYAITDITGPMKLLAASADGLWTFDAAGSGVEVTWAWELRPASPVAALVMPVFARFWRGYARRAMEQLEALLPV
ncbi:MAG TPA: SRPBCC family protein [Nocardioides sp.]|nr:SRPBCC family protein [Nocardioides sp.]